MKRKIDYKKLRTFKDIEIAKGKVRYDMLVAENHLYETLMSIERIFTITSFLGRFTSGFTHAQGAYSKISSLFGKIFKKKKKSYGPTPEDID
jgi:flagellar biosynthesis regulator FlbT